MARADLRKHDRGDTKFADLIHDKYLTHGMTKEAAIATVQLRAGLSRGAVWRALRGYRVTPETAEALRDWAYAEHGIEDLDVAAMMMAPAYNGGRSE